MGYFADIQRTVCRIPLGKVATYGDVARAAGHPGTARQVAWALHNADVRGIPWQRVLGSGGRILLPGRAGELQRELLEQEHVKFVGERADMERCTFRFPAAGKLHGRRTSPKRAGKESAESKSSTRKTQGKS
jgi:methylated-DNA-protein-cysteine methyltransferase related protein